MNALRSRLLRWLGVPADLRDQLDTLHIATLRNTTALAQVRRAQTADRARIDALRATKEHSFTQRANAVDRLIGPEQ